MKRTFIILVLLMLFFGAKQLHDRLSANEHPFTWQQGSLADVAKEVVAIPLQDSGKRQIKDAGSVRIEGNNLFSNYIWNQGSISRSRSPWARLEKAGRRSSSR